MGDAFSPKDRARGGDDRLFAGPGLDFFSDSLIGDAALMNDRTRGG